MSADYEFHGMVIPARFVASLQRWVDDGVLPGDFLTACLENDLSEAAGRADENNILILPAYVGWLYNEAPSACWGSPERVVAWGKRGGL